MKLGFLFFRGLSRRHPTRFLLIVLCAMFCFTGQLGLSWADASMTNARSRFEAACGTGDLVVYTEQAAPGKLRAMLSQIPGVDSVSEGRICEPVRCVCADGVVRSVRFFSFVSGDVITPIVDGTGELALSYGYQADFSAEAVSSLTLPDGQTLQVNATAAMPMFTGVYVDRFIPSSDGDMVDILAPAAVSQALTGESYVNYSVLTLAPSADADAVLDQIAMNDQIFVSYAAKEEPAYLASLDLAEAISRMCCLYPWIMLAVGLLFLCVFLAGVAGRCGDSISILGADGASIGSVFFALSLFGLTAMALGLILAIPAAGFLADYVARISLGNMGIPDPGLSISFGAPVLSLVSCLVLSMICAGISLLTVPKVSISRLRSRRSRPGLPVLITGISSAAAVCLVLVSMLFMDSLDAVRDEQFSDRYGYDVQIAYSDFVPVSRLEELDAGSLTERCEPMLFGTAQIRSGEETRDITCAALSQTPLLTLRDDSGVPLSVPENSILLSGHTAECLNLRPGDLANLRIRYGNTQMDVLCTVAGISRQSTGFLEAVSIGTVEGYLNSSGVMNSAAVRVRPGCLDEFVRYARSLPDIRSVQTCQAGRLRFDRRYAGTRVLIGVVIAVSALLGLSVCLLMCWIQWKQDLRRNTILYLMGESPVRLSGRSGLVRLRGLIPGLLAGLIAARIASPAMLAYLSTDTIEYPFAAKPATFLLGLLLCVGFEMGCQGMYYLSNRRQWAKPGSAI